MTRLVEIPGHDVLSMRVGLLGSLPAPWRLRITVGDATIDACSAVLPGTWSAVELVYMMAGVLLDRVSTEQIVKAARLRQRVSERWSWDRVSGGLVGVDPALVEGTLGDALERVGARLVGAWSGVEAEVGDGEEVEEQRPVRGVRARSGKPRGKMPPVSRR